MSIATPFAEFRTEVLEEHVDHNGHMGIRSYTRLFDQSTKPFYRFLGISRENLNAHGGTIFALQDTAWYRQEVMLGDPLLVTSQLIDHDHSKVVSFMTMHQTRDNYVAASFEIIEILISQETRKPKAFPDEIAQRLKEIQAAHNTLERPKLSGRGVGIRRA
tara:strand:+ start:5177 stop:5659 length:483 start_codon:yes stop_codon:yes gene_type:complete